MSRLAPFLACALAAGAGSVSADVRLERKPGTPRPVVRVGVTPSGPWTAPFGPDAAVLNPTGDLDSDGAPAVASSEAGWLVAWSSPARAQIRLARAPRDAWQPVVAIAAPEAVGTPLIVRVDGAWLVATRTRDGRVSAAGCTDGGGPSPLVDMGEGRLMGGRRTCDGAQLMLLRPDGCLETIGIRVIVPDPRPIDVYRTSACPPDRGRETPRAPGDHGGFEPYPGAPPSGDRHDDGRCTRGFEPSEPALREVVAPDGSSSWEISWGADVVSVDDRGDVAGSRRLRVSAR